MAGGDGSSQKGAATAGAQKGKQKKEGAAVKQEKKEGTQQRVPLTSEQRALIRRAIQASGKKARETPRVRGFIYTGA